MWVAHSILGSTVALALSWMGHWGAPSPKPSMAISSWHQTQKIMQGMISIAGTSSKLYMQLFRQPLSPWICRLKKTMTSNQRDRLSSAGVVIKTESTEGKTKVLGSKTFSNNKNTFDTFVIFFHIAIQYLLHSKFHNFKIHLRRGGPKLKATQVYTKKYAKAFYRFHAKYVVKTLAFKLPHGVVLLNPIVLHGHFCKGQEPLQAPSGTGYEAS